jgi:mannose-1-phosphate guanylyltransferase
MFYDFDGVTEQLCKVTRQRLKKFLECKSKWAKLKCQQAEIAKKSYENIDDGSVNISYMEKNPDTIKNRMVPSYEMLEEIL